jgi:hypothetical protein
VKLADLGEFDIEWRANSMSNNSGGRIWYLVDADARRVFVMYAATRHPKVTD